MNRFNLLPSVNWNISHMLVMNKDGSLCAYGSRGDIVIIKNVNKDNLHDFESKFIPRAHKNQRIMGLSFLEVEVDGELVESLVSCGDDGRIKIWNIESESMTHKCLIKKTSNISPKLVDLDVFPQNNCVVSASENGSVIKWNVNLNKMWTYTVDPKVIINCIATCPHVEDLLAIGAQYGLVLIYSLKGEGKLRHRIRCHDNAVFSLSWCPVPYNALQLSKLREDPNFDEEEWKKKDKTLLLASCSKDRSVYICKAGTNGYCEAVFALPANPVTNVVRYRNMPKNERGRFIKWIYPLVLLTSTDFNEMVSVYMFSKNEQNRSDSRQKVKISSVKFDIKPLHNIHKRNISNFAVHLYNSEDVDFRVWSCSSDRLLVRSGYRVNYKENSITLPLLSGYIFCLDISPKNPDLLAIGTGDGKICIWNLSTDNCVDITTLSKKIDNKVMSLRWHPRYEGVLAFGTYEGRVGMFDLSQGRTDPTLFKLFHNKPIYKLCWAPPVCSNTGGSTFKELYLFAVGNGDILQFNPSSHNEIPVSLNEEILAPIDDTCKCKHKSDLCYDPEQKFVAVGLSNGDVCICWADSFKLYHTITEQPKAIMSLAWHPKIVFEQPNEISACHNWLATAGDNVFVYSVDPQGLEAPKKVASLEVHGNRVLCVSWCPHVSGRLLSCSADNTAIVWDVLNQTIIGRYTQHCAQVLYGLWSTVNKDVVITGSADFTCRMWSITKDTVTKIVEPKKKIDKIIEPTVLNASSLDDSTASDTTSTSFTKNSKTQTFLPTVAQEFPHSLLLENVFENAINKLNGIEVESEPNPKEKANVDESSEELENSDEEMGKGDSIKVGQINGIMKRKKKPNTTRADCNYVQVFGSEDELLKLVLHEECALENSGNMSECFILSQARYDLSNKIKEAMNKNQVTEQILALAPSVSPKLWKEACQVYIEQMIKSDNIFQAVNYQLALGKEDEAIELLCEKNRFKEALALARLRTKDDTVKNVVEKWIGFCCNSGLYRLAAHCYMYLNDAQNACICLNKSKNLKDIISATKLLKYYQPKRAIELASECFKKYLLQLSASDVETLLSEFPDIKFVEPWYIMLKYFKEETPSTAAITKWLLGMQNENKLPLVASNEDYDKLRDVIMDNAFDMNYDQLMKYVSALAALYASGISHPEHRQSALRNYVRALSHCYNYKLNNSNRAQSDAAYPMMRLLKLVFPAGIFNEDPEIDLETDERVKMLYKSIKAFYCDFVFTWLVNCDDLPKSLKLLDQRNVENGDGDKAAVVEPSQDDTSEVYRNRFDIIKDKKSKLQKVVDLLTLYIADVLDSSTVSYLRESTVLKKLENGTSSKLNAAVMRKSIDTNDGIRKPSVDDLDSNRSIELSVNELENEKFNLSVEGLSLNRGSNSDVFVENALNVGKNAESEVDSINTLTRKYSESGEAAEMKILKELMDEFEKQRVSAPNPVKFYCIAKEYLERSRGVDDDLVSKLETLLNYNATKCGIKQD